VDWLEAMQNLSALNSLVYASLPDGPLSGRIPSRELNSFCFIADSRDSSIFAEDTNAACGMLERVIKKVGFAAVLYIKSDMLRCLDSHALVSQALRPGFDAAALVSGLVKRAPNLKSPAWLHVIFGAQNPQEMITYLFETKSVPDAVSGELRSVMDDISARYGYIPSAYNIWETLLSATELSSTSLGRLSEFLLARAVIPAQETMERVFSAQRVQRPVLIENLIHHPACPLPELTAGILLDHGIGLIILDSFKPSKKGDDCPSERCLELFSWCLRVRLLPKAFCTIFALLMEEAQSDSPTLKLQVHKLSIF
jgi:hypothetical protein